MTYTTQFHGLLISFWQLSILGPFFSDRSCIDCPDFSFAGYRSHPTHRPLTCFLRGCMREGHNHNNTLAADTISRVGTPAHIARPISHSILRLHPEVATTMSGTMNNHIAFASTETVDLLTRKSRESEDAGAASNRGPAGFAEETPNILTIALSHIRDGT